MILLIPFFFLALLVEVSLRSALAGTAALASAGVWACTSLICDGAACGCVPSAELSTFNSLEFCEAAGNSLFEGAGCGGTASEAGGAGAASAWGTSAFGGGPPSF